MRATSRTLGSSVLLLCLLISGCTAHVWTTAWLNGSKYCTPLPCATTSSIYGVCLDGRSVICSETVNTISDTLPEYLVPVYDLSCSQSQAVSLLGHMVVLYTQTQLLVLNMLPLQTQFYDCHTNETVLIQSNNATAQNSIKNFIIDLAPDFVQPTGFVGISSTTKPMLFTMTSPVVWSAMTPPTVPTVLGNWTLPPHPNMTAQWVASATYVMTIWSPKLSTYRVMSVPIVLGTGRIDCATSPWIRDRITCAALNRQLRQFVHPTGSRLDFTSQLYGQTNTIWTLPLQEQCQQLYLYPNSQPFNTSARTTESRLQFPAQLFNCPNPIQSRWIDLSLVQQASIMNVAAAEIPTAASPLPPSPTATPSTPSLFYLPTPPNATIPVQGEEKVDRTVDIIILVVILLAVVIGIVIHGVGCFYIRRCCRRRLMSQQHSGNVFITHTRAFWIRCCCLTSQFSHINDEYAHTAEDENDSSIRPTRHELAVILNDSQEESSRKVPLIDQEFSTPILDQIRTILAEDNPFETKSDRLPRREHFTQLHEEELNDDDDLEESDVFAANNNTVVEKSKKRKND